MVLVATVHEATAPQLQPTPQEKRRVAQFQATPPVESGEVASVALPWQGIFASQ
jgi:hypothetical protein